MKKLTAEQAIKKVLSSGQVSTQQDIVDAMRDLGIATNQSQVSRLLRKVNAIRVEKGKRGFIYCLPKEIAPPKSHMTLKGMVHDVAQNDHMVVLHTSPGGASLVARLLDHNLKHLGALGVLAGDDTIFIAPVKGIELAKLIQNIYQLLEVGGDFSH